MKAKERQIIFGSAIGIPTFFVHRNTGNTFLKRIVKNTQRVRSSAAIKDMTEFTTWSTGAPYWILFAMMPPISSEMLGMRETILDLGYRINEPDHFAASGKLTQRNSEPGQCKITNESSSRHI
ncbi:MAG: hypothetical protein MZU91_03795 [Desulfosudis oleivorans]|nr:hypothetical protein [Desulfosudis oleivorans]